MATAYMYGQAMIKALNKEITLGNNATGIKVMLCTSSYVPNQDTHVYKSSVTNEVSGTGYVAGGVSLTGVTVTYNASSNTIVVDANDVTWANSTIIARYAVIYDSTPSTDATRVLLGYIDFGSDIVSTNGTFGLTWDSTGIFNIVAS